MRINISLLNYYLDLNLINFKKYRYIFDILGLETKNIVKLKNDLFLDIEILTNKGDNLAILDIVREFNLFFLKDFTFYKSLENDNKNFLFKKKNINIFIDSIDCINYCILELDVYNFFFDIKKLKIFYKYIFKYVENFENNSFIVNLIKYITICIGQPVQIYDADKISGNIRICNSTKDEYFLASNNVIYFIKKDTLVVRDDLKIISIAGIIDSKETMVTKNTYKFLIEISSYVPNAIKKNSKIINLSSFSSFIFEKGINFKLVKYFFFFFFGFLKNDFFFYNYEIKLFYNLSKKKDLFFDINLINYFFKYKKKNNINYFLIILKKINYKIKVLAEKIVLYIPLLKTWNVINHYNIIEDFIKILNFNNFCFKKTNLINFIINKNISINYYEKIENFLLNNGFSEVITKSYFSNKILSYYIELNKDIEFKIIKLINNSDSNFSNLKFTNLTNMLNIYLDNFNKKNFNLKIYEIGKIYIKNNDILEEKEIISLLYFGHWYSNFFKKNFLSFSENFFLFKGVLESIISFYCLDIRFKKSSIFFLHSYFQLEIYCLNENIGFFGLPNIKFNFDFKINSDLFYCELNIEKLIRLNFLNKKKKKNSLYRDLTYKINISMNSSELIYIIKDIDFAIYEVLILDYFKIDEIVRKVTYRIVFNDIYFKNEANFIIKILDKVNSFLLLNYNIQNI